MANRHTADKRVVNVEPSEVAAEDGIVTVDGPDGLAVAMTPEAAIETGYRLIQAGATAQEQRTKAS